MPLLVVYKPARLRVPAGTYYARFMAINARFSIDGGEHMAEKYIGMGVSKLQEMLGLPDEELEKVTAPPLLPVLGCLDALLPV